VDGVSVQPPPRSEEPVEPMDPIRRLHALAAAIPGCAVAEGVLDAPFEAVWETVGDLEHAGGIEILVKDPHITERRPDPTTGGERIRLEYKARPIMKREVLDVDLRPGGWCFMQSQLGIAAMAAAPEGERTRFAHLEAVRLPGRRLFAPMLKAKMSLARELRRFERQAQERARRQE
jgi:hypothetical protein